MILNDSSLFSNSADITTKEILKRYGDRAKAPTVNSPAFNSNKVDSYAITSSSPVPGQTPNSYANRDGANNAGPVAHRVDTDTNVATAWKNESSVRHVGSDLEQRERGMATPPALPYANARNSSESNGSPHRGSANMRSAAWDKQRAMGMV